MCAFGRNSRHFKQCFDNYMGCFTFCCFNVCQMNLPEGVLAQSLIVIYVPYWVTFWISISLLFWAYHELQVGKPLFYRSTGGHSWEVSLITDMRNRTPVFWCRFLDHVLCKRTLVL